MSYDGFEESFSTLLESVEIGKGVSDSVSVDELLQILHQPLLGEHLRGKSQGRSFDAFHLSEAILKDILDPVL